MSLVAVCKAIEFKKYVLSLDIQCRGIFLETCVDMLEENSEIKKWFIGLCTITQGDESKGEKKPMITANNTWAGLFEKHMYDPKFEEIYHLVHLFR